MKGKVLDFSIQTNTGIISGEDGNRYNFEGNAWKETSQPSRGATVDFDVNEKQQAIDIFLAQPSQTNFSGQQNNTKNLSKTWQFRFDFFNKYGVRGDKNPEFKKQLKQLKFRERGKINYNLYAFFFSMFYFLILGLWRKGLALLGIYIILAVILEILNAPDNLFSILGIIYSSAFSYTANIAYYLKERRNSKSWNPFEGLF